MPLLGGAGASAVQPVKRAPLRMRDREDEQDIRLNFKGDCVGETLDKRSTNWCRRAFRARSVRIFTWMVADPLQCCPDLVNKLVAESGTLFLVPNRSAAKLCQSFAMKISRHGAA